ncbi:Detected protein of unknown function [Hibiscus syriacus]|uniref:Uncharacterized protein n=1 Tax=Hibiscus syriacus TaxID=106335 RepID=A0A6A3CGU1_HIBSY|nr:uncharacterized protein LOC120200772 [Hibiscus syriacus]KAE8726642.1 Detected protein of unknown function [Hibiscus syriacus]
MANEFLNFPPNLDDGELWLPSDIFLNDVPSKIKPHLHHHNSRRLPFSCMEDLASRFAALKLPKHHQKLSKAVNFERVQEPVCYGTVNRSGLEAGQSFYGFRSGPFLGGTKPVYECQFVKPTQAQVESYVEARARVLQRLQNRLFQNRDLPFQANGFNNYKHRLGGGLVRTSGGTGVFHPRVLNSTFDSEKKQGLRNRQSQEIQVSREMKAMKGVSIVKQEDCHYHLPPEMGFPRDWI